MSPINGLGSFYAFGAIKIPCLTALRNGSFF
jgi:hypothetical protein